MVASGLTSGNMSGGPTGLFGMSIMYSPDCRLLVGWAVSTSSMLTLLRSVGSSLVTSDISVFCVVG